MDDDPYRAREAYPLPRQHQLLRLAQGTLLHNQPPKYTRELAYVAHHLGEAAWWLGEVEKHAAESHAPGQEEPQRGKPGPQTSGSTAPEVPADADRESNAPHVGRPGHPETRTTRTEAPTSIQGVTTEDG